jgi:hypothetical protein
MDMRSYSARNYIKLEDVSDGPIEKVIVSVAAGGFNKPDITFSDGSVLSANKTTVLQLNRKLGYESSSWLGQGVEVYEGPVTYNGSTKPGVLARAIDEAPSRKPGDNSDLNDSIDI